MKFLAIIGLMFLAPEGTETHMQNRDTNGKVTSEGWVCENGLRQKNWVFYHSNGTFESCEYVNDRRQGWYKLHRADTAILMIGPYYKDERQRFWKAYYDDATTLRWEGRFSNDQKTDWWKTYYPNGRIESIGEYKKDLPHGKWEYFDSTSAQVIAEGDFHRGMKHGEWNKYYSDGTRESEGAYVKDKENGWWIYYHSNGRMKEEGVFDHGQKVGVWTQYNDEGGQSGAMDYGE